jgi:F-type H+-transporting ATPase subunit a
MIGLLLASENPLDHVVQHTLVELNPGGGFWSIPLISNHIIMQVIAAVLVILVIPRAVKARAGADTIGKLVPRGVGNAIEALCEALRKNIFQPNLGGYTDRFSPYLWSTFFFIFACNILGMIPLSDWLFFAKYGGHAVIGGTSTGNIFVTGTLAVCTLVMIVFNGLRFHGMAYLKHFFMGPFYLSWFVAILEIAGLGFKSMALAVRLFANMLAGHILLAVLLGFVGGAWNDLGAVPGTLIGVAVVGASVAVYFLEIVVAFLHAFIFTALTAVFIGMAVNIHHDEHEPEEENAPAEVAAQH